MLFTSTLFQIYVKESDWLFMKQWQLPVFSAIVFPLKCTFFGLISFLIYLYITSFSVFIFCICFIDRLRWSRGSVLAFSTQVRRRIFKGEKILSAPSFGGEVKTSVPCRRFAACKRSLKVAWKTTFRQNYRTILAHNFHLSPLGSLASAWGHLVAERVDVVWTGGGSGNV